MRKFETLIRIATTEYELMGGLREHTAHQNEEKHRQFIEFYLQRLQTLMQDLEVDLDSGYRSIFKGLDKNSGQSAPAVLSNDNLPNLN